MRIAARFIASIAIAALLAACGGGGTSSGTPVVPATTGSQSAQTVPVTFHIVVPSQASAHTRLAQYISAGTATASIKVNGGTAQTGSCTSMACNVTVNAPVGMDAFVVQLLSSASAVLSEGSTSQAISGTAANTVNLAFGGVPKSVTITAATANFVPGTLASYSALTIVVKDAAGDTIVGSDTYVDSSGNPNPITLTKSDGSAYTSLTTTSLTSPATSTSTLGYTGSTTLYGATITLSATGTGITATPATVNVYAQHAFIEYPVPTAATFPSSITNGPDGNVWFGEQNGHKIGKVTPAGVVTEYTPTTTASIGGLTSGPDGNVWFTELNVGKVGKINPITYALTEYAGGNTPSGITTGYDGDLWFADFNPAGGGVGQISTSGSLHETTVGSNNQIEDVALGPDHRIWFTIPFTAGNYIGAIDTSYNYSVYTVTSGSTTRSIVAGPDGRMWYTDDGNNEVGAISTDGSTYVEYPPTTSGSSPEGITVGHDNNLWITELGANKIARFTTSGVCTEYTIPTAGSQPFEITNGPDGNIWFVEAGGNQVGRFVL